MTVTYSNPYFCLETEISDLSYEVLVGSNNQYNFSFINQSTDWSEGFTNTIGAKATFKITGPSFIIRGNKGPNYGKLKLVITPENKIGFNTFSSEEWSQTTQILDCYSGGLEQDVILYQKNDLKYLFYTIEIENLYDKNISSLDNNIKINSYSFSYNIFSQLDKEQINQNIHSYTQYGVLR